METCNYCCNLIKNTEFACNTCSYIHTYDVAVETIKKWADLDVIFHDHEFTGLEHYDRIVESCFINLKGDTLFHSRFNPEQAMSKISSRLTGINTNELFSEPDLRSHWQTIFNLINGRKIVSWGASIDERMLRTASEIYETPFVDETEFLDLHPIYIKLNSEWSEDKGRFEWMSLKNAATKENVYKNAEHSAISDTKMVLGVFNNLLRLKSRKKVEEKIGEVKNNPFELFFNSK